MTSGGSRRGRWWEWLVVATAATLAFALGYVHSVAHPTTSADGARVSALRLLTPAVNYACTGRFGPLRLAPDATPADATGLGGINAFLTLQQPRYPCRSFPQHVLVTGIFDGIDPANVEHPFYLVVVYGVLWRWFGVQWALVDYLVAANWGLKLPWAGAASDPALHWRLPDGRLLYVEPRHRRRYCDPLHHRPDAAT